MKPVDFFIVGAPKSGTTALYHYLSEHPQIFFPEHKEPCYFASDYPNMGGRIKSLSDYQRLYEACPENKISGDASVVYLGSESASSQIKAYNPDAKIIIMLRNPVELFLSEHSQLLFSFYEDVSSPIEAWRMQESRKAGKNIPPTCREPEILQYLKTCSLGINVSRYLNAFGEGQVHLIFFEDFKANPGMIYKDTLNYLGLKDDGRKSFPAINEAKTHGGSVLAKWLISPPGVFGDFHASLRRLVATTDSSILKGVERLAKWLLSRLSKKRDQKMEISKEDKVEVSDSLNKDVILLESISGRNLDAWKLT